MRKQPWRPRSAWLGNRAGARRRGVLQDAGRLASDFLEGSDDLFAPPAAAGAPDDVLVAEAVSELVANTAVPARVDVSGLLAIADTAPMAPFAPQGNDVFQPVGWHAFGERGDEDALRTRHSA